ncbi:23S rRNA (uracil(1939)-C(5))-methyltransferase RlmD [Methylophilaceae bacterium]|nr:23S rRNA (uracil(1939)-C(5))-methyltransferase RlmD [Methylophilaceae bacterium]
MEIIYSSMAKVVRNRIEKTFITTISSVSHEGKGIAYQDDKTIFIDNALLNEEVEYRIIKKKKNLAFAKSLNIIKPSTQRVKAKCDVYGVCGGCSMQHFDEGAQLSYKQRAFEEALEHVGNVMPESISSPISGPLWHYRHKARLRVKFVLKKNKVLIGFNEKMSHFLTNMIACPVLPKKISDLIEPLQNLFFKLSIRDQIPQIEYASNQVRHILVIRILASLTQDDENILKSFQELNGIEFWSQTKGYDTVKPLFAKTKKQIIYENKEFNLKFLFHPTGFTQINPFINQILIRKVMVLLQPLKSDVIFDLFSGMGNFTLPIATSGATVLAIDGDESLVESGNRNAIENNLSKNVTFKTVDLFNIEKEELLSLGKANKWLIDPPRLGALNLINLIDDATKPKLIIYISCNPATLARDSNILVNEKKYIFKEGGIVNMFPHTSHIESISVFEVNE